MRPGERSTLRADWRFYPSVPGAASFERQMAAARHPADRYRYFPGGMLSAPPPTPHVPDRLQPIRTTLTRPCGSSRKTQSDGLDTVG